MTSKSLTLARTHILLLVAVTTAFVASGSLAQDATSPPEKKLGFFGRLGNALFKGSRKMEGDPAAGDSAKTPAKDATKSGATKARTDSKRKRAADDEADIPVGKIVTDESAYDVRVKDKKKHDRKSSSESKAEDAKKPDDAGTPANDTAGRQVETLETPPTPHVKVEYPVGIKTEKPDRVKSPFTPNNELNVSGLASGSLAWDPTVGKIFRLP